MLKARLVYFGVFASLLAAHPFVKVLSHWVPSGLGDGHL